MDHLNPKSILRQIPSDCKIRTYLKQLVFGKNLKCPHCGCSRIKRYDKRYHCRKCRKFFSLTSCNWLKSMKIPLSTFWLVLWCWTQKVPVDQTVKVTGLSETTIRRWFDKFRSKIPQEFALRLTKNIQIDEFYRGGKKKGYSIIGAKQKGTKKIVLKVIKQPSVTRNHVMPLLIQHVEPNSNLFSDGSSIYKTIDYWWPVKHQYEIHKKFEFALTSEIEGLWGNFVTFIRRMYHHITLSNLEEYVNEFVARFSHQNWFNSPLTFLKISLCLVSF